VLVSSFAGFTAMLEGETEEGLRRLREVVEWGTTAGETLHVLWSSFAAFWVGDPLLVGELVDRAGALARSRGEVGFLAETLGMRAAQLAMEQRYDDAAVKANEAVALARELGAGNLELLPRAALAIVAAVRGEDDEARRQGEVVLERAGANGLPLRTTIAEYALALSELGRARWAEALSRIDELLAHERSALDPLMAAMIPDKIEAAVRAGRPDDARAALPEFEARVAYVVSGSAPARLAACRALLSAGDEATAHYEEALRAGAAARPFDLARIHLLYGEHLRRERRRTDARVQLRAALEAFERFRAEPWAERARAELRASGETARKRDPSTVSQLTPQEVQVARFVADGLSNKEIAAQLFLSPRTIDSHVRNIFGKLGITSRVQLARLALDDAPAA
jgi:DNA-binding CsgD family transcriptional regulator